MKSVATTFVITGKLLHLCSPCRERAGALLFPGDPELTVLGTAVEQWPGVPGAWKPTGPRSVARAAWGSGGSAGRCGDAGAPEQCFLVSTSDAAQAGVNRDEAPGWWCSEVGDRGQELPRVGQVCDSVALSETCPGCLFPW